MRFRVSPCEIRRGYNGIKRIAQEAFYSGNIGESLEYINHCAVLAQQFNWIYTDNELEDLLAAIGGKTLVDKPDGFTPISNRVVFYDDFCTSFVLALQYMRALVADGKEILYITSRDVSMSSQFSTIIDEIKNYPGTIVHIVPQGDPQYRIRNVFYSIVGFQPEKVLLHMFSNSIAIPALYHLPTVIDRYIINLADQTFWLGKKAIDYSLEFRGFGASVSLQKRDLKKEQLLMIPFYPIADNNVFEGFPIQCSNDKVIIFSGGDLYKVIDHDKAYWRLVKEILNRYPEVVFLFATKVTDRFSDVIDRFIMENHFEGRFIYIGFRKDINEVFKHCDIYMGTCPASGSLMSQLAAINSKPILQYYYPQTPDDETEQVLCFNDEFAISFRDFNSFLDEANRLIKDKEYRVKQGKRLQSAMLEKNQFNSLVALTLEHNKSQLPLKLKKINYSVLNKRWFDLECEGLTETMPYILGVLKNKNSFWYTISIQVKKRCNYLFSKFHEIISS